MLNLFYFLVYLLSIWSVPLSVGVSPLPILVVKDGWSILRMDILWHLKSLWVE